MLGQAESNHALARLACAALASLWSACDQADPCLEPAPGLICTVAGAGARAFNGDGRAAVDTALYLPSAAELGPDGRLYIVDFNNQRIRAVGEDGRVATVVGSGMHSLANTGMPALRSPLENPVDIEFGPQGDLIFVSLHDPRVLRVDADGILHGVAGIGEIGDSGDGGPGYAARFSELTSVAVAADGSIFVADGGAARVRVIRPDGQVEAYAGSGSAGSAGDGGPAHAAELVYPAALAMGMDGELYIADAGAHVVRRVLSDGTIATYAGTGEPGSAGDGGPALAAELHQPEGVAVDPRDGSVYISEWRGHRIRRVARDGVIETIAGTGEAGHAGDGGPARAAALFAPARLFCAQDRLYVADQQNDRVRVVYLR